MPRPPAVALPAMTDGDLRRFWEKVVLPNGTGCLEWTSTRNEAGYGIFKVGGRAGRRCRAHRVAYVLAYGEPDPELTLDHLCRNRACVNPEHLEPVTVRENTMRGETPLVAAARANVCPRGHGFDDANTVQRADGRRRCRACRNESRRRDRRG